MLRTAHFFDGFLLVAVVSTLLRYISIILGAIHGWAAKQEKGWAWSDSEWATGFYLLVAMTMLFVTAINYLRRNFFEVFYALHWIFLLATLLFGGLHGAGLIALPVFLWCLDVVYRYFYLAGVAYTHEATITALPADVVRVSFPKANFNYRGGQYVFLCVPKLGMFQWHPFSISSAPFEDHVSIHIRVLGGWTKALRDMAGDSPKKVQIYFEGPYGEPGVDLQSTRYEHVLLVSGGIGITPMQSICNELMHQYARGRPLRKVWFVWSCRDKYMVSALHDTEDTAVMPKSFSPDMLMKRTSSLETDAQGQVVKNDKSEPLHTEYYLTRARDEADYADANIRPSEQKHLRLGRPNIPKIFDEMRKICKDDGCDKVAALVCGPTGLVKAVNQACWDATKEGVRFEFHSETFEF